MDASSAARRRLPRIGATPSVGAANAGADTEIAATEAITRARSSSDSDDNSQPQHGQDERDRPAEERYEMATETRRMLLETVDPCHGSELWLVQGEAMTRLYGTTEQAGGRADGPGAPPGGAHAEGVHAARRLGSRAYAGEEPEPAPAPEVSKTV